MRVLVVGAGGREHALCWRLSQSPSVDRIYALFGPAKGALKVKAKFTVETLPDAPAEEAAASRLH